MPDLPIPGMENGPAEVKFVNNLTAVLTPDPASTMPLQDFSLQKILSTANHAKPPVSAVMFSKL